MFRNWTFGRKLGGGFAVSAIALAIVAVTAFRSNRTLISNDEWVAHTQLVRRQIAALVAQVVDAESSQRGFVLTGRDAFLEPYTQALPVIDKTFADLRQLTIDNPHQTRRLDALRPLIDEKLAVLKRGLEIRRSESLEAAAAAISSGQGQTLIDKIRALIAEMDQEELGLLDIRKHDSVSASETTKVVIIWGSLTAILLTILVGWLITSSLSGQVGSAVRHIQSSSTELQASANQQATGAREQATAMTEIATTINELLATSRQIAESAKRVSQIAGQTATAARNGEVTVTKGHDATTTVRKQVDLIVGHMLDLGKKSQQVGSVLDIVSELAEQTNILAINATIEAAGAGDAGRRFGVVAEEIRKLADRVGASTKEIRTMIEDVRAAVNTTVMATEAGSKAVDVGTAQVVEMATSFRQIASLVGTTTDAAREIELSTKQQATAVEQVNVAISGAAGATRETEASARETLQTASQLADLSTDVLTIVQRKAS
ncbi:MAG TPA: CHASE3 domain-containing protein [Kofleriaceae bacterium]|nr:CHASE3 domain-containing protein [Kofleriaceae bacterium]